MMMWVKMKMQNKLFTLLILAYSDVNNDAATRGDLKLTSRRK